MQTISLPFHLPSRSNLREHWGKRHKREKKLRAETYIILKTSFKPVELPITVRLERMGAKLLDDDNLRGALKAVRDGVADWLKVDDADDRVSWEYAQGTGSWSAIVTIKPRGEVCPTCGREIE